MREHKKVGWCELVRWVVPPEGAVFEDVHRDAAWWEHYTSDKLKNTEDRLDPDGFMLLENQLMDSSKFGQRFVLPFGGESGMEKVPEGPFSIDGTASGTVCVMAVYFSK
jgi:hypothetical protein